MKNIYISVLLMVFSLGVNFAQVRKVVNAEYFWDTDPGQGNATALIAFDGNFDNSIEAVTGTPGSSSLSVGVHKLGVRVKGANNAWGTVFSTIVSIQNTSITNRPVKVIAGEYFWDADPGQGNATALIAFDGNFDNSIEAVTGTSGSSSLSVGVHKLGVRVKGADNAWGPVFSTIVSVQNTSITNRPVKVIAGECFWSTDPGQGNGMAMLAFDGNFNQSIEAVTKSALTGALTIGANVLYVRVKGANNSWGPKFGVVVNVQTPSLPDAVIYGQTNFCSSQLSGITYFVDSVAGYSYNWTITGGTIVTSSTKPQVTVNWNASGPYQLQVVETNLNGTDTAKISITVTLSTTAPVASSNAPQCSGANVTLNASLVNGATYSWTGPGFNSILQNPVLVSSAPSMSGYYQVVAIINGCPSEADSVLVNIYPYPSAPVVSHNGPVCEGDTLKLNANNVAGGAFSWSGPNGFTSSVQNTYLISSLNSAGTYSASVTVNGCASTTSITTSVTVYAKPATPTITQIGADLHSNYTNGNQWYLNGNIIPGTTGNVYTPTQNGLYAVSVTNANNCSALSNPYNFNYLGINSTASGEMKITIYPNPNSGYFMIELTSTYNDWGALQLYNYIGEKVYIESFAIWSGNNKKMISLNDLADGVYTLRVSSEEINSIQKVIVSR